jgi:hypothetical protein
MVTQSFTSQNLALLPSVLREKQTSFYSNLRGAVARKSKQTPPGFKVQTGYNIRLLTQRRTFASTYHANLFYWKVGFSRDMHDWLLHNFGPSCSYLEWEQPDCTTRWLFTGSMQQPGEYNGNFTRGNQRLTLNIWIRDRHDAMIFKLRWLEEA